MRLNLSNLIFRLWQRIFFFSSRFFNPFLHISFSPFLLLFTLYLLLEVEKGVMVVKPHEVAISKQRAQFSILFKLQTNKDFNKEAFKSSISNLCRCSHDVTIEKVEQNLFLAIFVKGEDLKVILDKSLWSFNKRLVLMKGFYCDLSPCNVTFLHSPFWICVFNITIKSMNKDVEARIANEIGELY